MKDKEYVTLEGAIHVQCAKTGTGQLLCKKRQILSNQHKKTTAEEIGAVYFSNLKKRNVGVQVGYVSLSTSLYFMKAQMLPHVTFLRLEAVVLLCYCS